MKLKKIAALAFAGALVACMAVGLSGCFGTGGGGNGGGGSNGGGGGGTTPDPEPVSPMVGSWLLSYATDFAAEPYTDVTSDTLRLEIASETQGTLYLRNEPFEGTLSRRSDQDANYAVAGYKVECYGLTNDSGTWLLSFVTPNGNNGDPFWYVQMMGDGVPEHFYLQKSGANTSVLAAFVKASDLKIGTWKLSYATNGYGQTYNLSQETMDRIYLECPDSESGTFYYLDSDPFKGTLEYASDSDASYAVDGYAVHVYKLRGTSSYWELAFYVELSNPSNCFWYLEVGQAPSDRLFLAKVN